MKLRLRPVLLSLAAAATLSIGGAASAQQPFRIGVVDVQRAMETTEDGMRATATLKKLFDAKQQELSQREQTLLKQREELEKQARVVSQAAIQKQMEAWQKQMLELQTTYVEYNKDLQKKRVELLYPVQDKVMRAIQSIAHSSDSGFDLIIDKATVAFARSDLDLTDRVIQAANTGVAGPRTAPPPGAPTATAPMPLPVPTGGPALAPTGVPRPPPR